MRAPPLVSQLAGLASIAALGGLGCSPPSAAPAPASSPTAAPPPVVAPAATVFVAPPAASSASPTPPTASAASSSAAPASAVPIVTHPRPPQRKADVAPFLRAGCTQSGPRLVCDKVPAIHAMGCEGDALWVDDTLAPLAEKHPIAACLARQQPGTSVATAPQGLVEVGCMIPAMRRYVVADGPKLVLVTSAQELASRYAPIESEAAAIALATAASKARPLYDVELPARMKVFLPRVETSFARPRGDGSFDVLLYEREVCGCGPHTEHEVRFRVTRGGDVQRTSDHPAWQDPADHMCVD